jgi:dTDP-4-amino-4,6-dideoxygalactose transaminase
MIPVHLYGQPAEMNELQALAKDHGLKIVEDCAQAHGATYRGTHIGTIGDAAAFSFYPGKNLGAYGDAGAMVTADADLAEKARMLACHGQQAKHDHHLEGRNSRLDGLQAAVLRVKLGHLTEWIQIRRHTAAQYYQELANLPLLLPATQLYAEHAYHLFVVQTEHRDNLASELKNQGISTGIHYPKALPYTYVYQQRFRHTSEDFPTAYDMQSRILSLPIGDHMTEELTHQVIRATIEALV